MFEKIKADQLVARKARDSVASSLLTTLIGAIQQETKEPNDAICQAKIRSFLKSNDEMQKALVLSGKSADATMREASILHSYLPIQMAEEEIRQFVRAKIDQGSKSLGDLMKMLKSEKAGLYDGKLAGTIIKQELETFQTF